VDADKINTKTRNKRKWIGLEILFLKY
jgi:hypothetical protein